MSRPQFFLISSAIIFLLERILPTLTSWPVFIFPVFIILFILTSKSDTDELVYVPAASLFFDFFSGYRFGFFTLAVLTVVLAIFLFKTRFNVSRQSLFSLVIYTFIFTFAYFAIISIMSSPRFLIDQAYTIMVEVIVVFIMFNLVFHKVGKKLKTFHGFRQIQNNPF